MLLAQTPLILAWYRLSSIHTVPQRKIWKKGCPFHPSDCVSQGSTEAHNGSGAKWCHLPWGDLCLELSNLWLPHSNCWDLPAIFSGWYDEELKERSWSLGKVSASDLIIFHRKRGKSPRKMVCALRWHPTESNLIVDKCMNLLGFMSTFCLSDIIKCTYKFLASSPQKMEEVSSLRISGRVSSWRTLAKWMIAPDLTLFHVAMVTELRKFIAMQTDAFDVKLQNQLQLFIMRNLLFHRMKLFHLW